MKMNSPGGQPWSLGTELFKQTSNSENGFPGQPRSLGTKLFKQKLSKNGFPRQGQPRSLGTKLFKQKLNAGATTEPWNKAFPYIHDVLTSYNMSSNIITICAPASHPTPPHPQTTPPTPPQTLRSKS